MENLSGRTGKQKICIICDANGVRTPGTYRVTESGLGPNSRDFAETYYCENHKIDGGVNILRRRQKGTEVRGLLTITSP